MNRTNASMLQGFKWLTVFLLWIYVAARAVMLAFTHDEAYSFLLIKTNYFNAMTGTANTHWLNSLGMKLGSLLLGDEEWKLRLFSVLAWPVYGISALRISSLLQRPFASLLLFCALVFNPYVLDFFSLARGYGLQFAFVLAALWQAFRLLQDYRWDLPSWTPVFALAAVAVFSNYTALYFFLSLLAAYSLLAVAVGKAKQFWPPRVNRWWVVVACTCIAAISNLFFIKYYSGDLEFGGDDLVYSLFETVAAGSLYVETRFTFQDPEWVAVLGFMMLLSVFIGIIIAVVDYHRRRRTSPLLLMAFVVSFFLLQTILFHYLFDTPYLAHRTALILYPLIVILLFLAGEKIQAKAGSMQWVAIGLKTAFFVLIAFNFYRAFNFTYCHEWKINADSERNFDALQRHGAKKVLAWQWYGGVWVNYYNIAPGEKYRFQPRFYVHGDQMKASQGFRDSLQTYDHAILFPPYQLEKLRTPQVDLKVLETFPTGVAIVQILKK